MLVTGVSPKSPAERAGINASDVIIAIDGNEISEGRQVAMRQDATVALGEIASAARSTPFGVRQALIVPISLIWNKSIRRLIVSNTPKPNGSTLALLSLGLAIAIEPGTAWATANDVSFAGKLQTLHHAITTRRLSITHIKMRDNTTDGSHAIKIAQDSDWSQAWDKFSQYHPGFAQ